MGSGGEGVWIPCGLNECIKIGRYETGCHFSPHIDGPWIPDENCASILTLVLYLNDSESPTFPLKGGATNFLLPSSSSSSSDPSSTTLIGRSQRDHEILCSVTPKTGNALLFRHDLLHEGAPLLDGRKYILRTEVLFRRIKSALKVPRNPPAEFTANQICVTALYNQSEAEFEKGKAEDFVESYLAALDLQKEGTPEGPHFILPPSVILEILRIVASFEENEILLMRMMMASKGLYRLGRTGELWRRMYLSRWPEDVTSVPTNENPLTIDWFKLFKRKFIATHPNTTTRDNNTHNTAERRSKRKERREWLLSEDDSYLLARKRLGRNVTLGDVGAPARKTIVFDSGSQTTRVGLADQERPTSFIPTIVGTPRSSHNFNASTYGNSVAGEKALEYRNKGVYSHAYHWPIQRGETYSMLLYDSLYPHAIHDVLQVDPKEHYGILTASPTETEVEPSFEIRSQFLAYFLW